MMQNSLERLLAGVAAALRTDIAPALEDEFARRQALAGAEVLEQLVPRVQWRADDLRAVIGEVRPLLEAAAGPGDPDVPDSPPPGAEGAELVAARDAHLRALAGLQARLASQPGADEEELRARTRATALRLLERELSHAAAARAVARRAAS